MPILNIDYKSKFFNIKKRQKHWDMPLHIHSNVLEIYYLCYGKVRYIVDDSFYTMEDGDIIFIPSGAEHRTTALAEGHERFVVNIPVDGFDKELLDMLRHKFYSSYLLTIPVKKRVEFGRIIACIEREIEKKDTFSKTLIENYFYEFIVFVLRNANNSKNITTNKSPVFVHEIMHYVRKEFANNISLEDIAENLHMNKAYISRKFKEIIGIGISEYIINVRIDEASRLLLSTDESITDVAFKCGFENSNYFAAVFKRVTGVTPLKYRKMNRM